MAESKTYTVRRQHTSGRGETFLPGDSRELTEADATQLINLGVLEEGGSGSASAKSESRPAKTKARDAAPDNK